jgi:hypothetical protein
VGRARRYRSGGGQHARPLGTDDCAANQDRRLKVSRTRRNGASLPLSALVDQFYAQVQKMADRRWDTSSLIALLQR